MTTTYLVVAWTLLILMLIKTVATVTLARRYHRRPEVATFRNSTLTTTIIVPAYNEEASIANCLLGMQAQTYPHLDVLVVDDGSTDDTYQRALTAAESVTVPVRVVRQQNGGKAAALNFGLLETTSDIVICVDADSTLEPDAVARIVAPFDDPSVAAVGGNVKVANRRSLLGKHQAMEYLSGLNLQRAAFAELGAVPVLSGALSAFRADDLRAVGGYSSDTLVEDFDVTVAIQSLPDRRVHYLKDAVAWTEGPLNLRDFIRQRHRWTYGGFQVLGKHRHITFTVGSGRIGSIGLPYFLIGPWFDVTVSGLYFFTITVALLAGVSGVASFVAFAGAMSLLAFALNLYAARLSGERRRLAFWGAIQFLFYAHLLTFITVRAGLHYVSGKKSEWTKLKRGGSNVLPEDVRT